MHLVGEELTITLDGVRLYLRPSLRAAARLERRHGGFAAIMRGLEEGSVTVIADVITECSITQIEVVSSLLKPGLASRLTFLVPALQCLVLDLMGYDPEAEEKAEGGQDADPRLTYAEVHARLYKLATGWLGWTPTETWAASPAEIRHAYEGRLELLRAVFGGGGETEDKAAPPPASVDDKFAALQGRLATLRIEEAA
jgi:hypothetical protein